MDEGWIKVHRKILDNPVVMKDSDYLAVWLYLLLKATHKKMNVVFKGKKRSLKKGQLITGRKKIAEELKISESKVKRILIELETDHQIDRQRSSQNSLVTILNWDKYQESDQQNDQPVTSKRPTNDQPVTTNKNERMKKENIDEQKELLDHFELIWKIYPNKKGKAKAIEYYLQWIKGRKVSKTTIKLTDKQMYYAVKKYAEECENQNTEIRFIKHGDTFFNKAILDYVENEDE